jgi:hypothetical protein
VSELTIGAVEEGAVEETTTQNIRKIDKPNRFDQGFCQ